MKWHRSAAVLSALTFVVVLGSAPRATAQPYCGITWGSLAKTSPEYTGAQITGARVGAHDCWDRLVIDLNGMPAPGYNVRYTDAFRAEGSGTVLPTAGGAIITISAHAWASVPWSVGTHVVSPEQLAASGFRTLRDVVYGGTYEGNTSIGLGVRARLPFRVFKLDGPDGGSRLVIDVAHQW